MIISGLQKLSLVDWPGRVACTVFLGGCAFRCPYCHNSELLSNPPRLMEAGELLAFLEKRRGMLDGVCVSGGEPCIQGDLPDLIREIRARGFAVKLDTNGFYPQRLEGLIEEGLLDYAAVDIKNDAARYAGTAGVAEVDLTALQRSVSALLESALDFELRTTVALPLHDASSFEGMRDMLAPLVARAGRRVPRWYLQPFVDRETVAWAGLSAPERGTLEKWRAPLRDVSDAVLLRG